MRQCVHYIGSLTIGKKTIADVLVLPLTETEIAMSTSVADYLRVSGINTDILFERMSMKKKFKYADSIGVPKVIVIGSNEVNNGLFTIQDMSSGIKTSSPLADLPLALRDKGIKYDEK